MMLSPFLVRSVFAAAALSSSARSPTAADDLTLTLQSVRETRSLDLRPEEDRGGMSTGGEPGLELSFRAALPAGAKISRVTQPAAVESRDSVGTDLAALAPDLFGTRELLSAESWFDEAPALRLRLAPAARKAESFSVHLEASITIYDGVDPHDVAQSDAWTKFSHASLAAIGAEYQFRMTEDSCRLSVRPAAARDLIEAVLPAAPDAQPGGYSVTYDDETAAFDVDPRPEPDQKIRLFVRAGVRTIPVKIDLKDQKLP